MKPRFSIRDLLWLTALAAVLTACWIDHRTMRHEIDDFTQVNLTGPSAGPTLFYRKSERDKLPWQLNY
jgi:hypothetical protein